MCLVADLDHFPKDDTRLDVSRTCCVLCRWATGKQLRDRLLCSSICNVRLCVSFYHLFHTVSETRHLKSEVKNHCLKSK